jgi:hypothetical protein
MSSTALSRRGVPGKVAPEVFGFWQRGEFPGEQPVWYLLRWYSTGMQRTSGNNLYLLQWYSGDTQSTMWVLISCCLAHFISSRAKSKSDRAKTALQKILPLEEIRG